MRTSLESTNYLATGIDNPSAVDLQSYLESGWVLLRPAETMSSYQNLRRSVDGYLRRGVWGGAQNLEIYYCDS